MKALPLEPCVSYFTEVSLDNFGEVQKGPNGQMYLTLNVVILGRRDGTVKEGENLPKTITVVPQRSTDIDVALSGIFIITYLPMFFKYSFERANKGEFPE